MRGHQGLLTAIAVIAAALPARAEDVVGYAGPGLGHSSNKFETEHVKWEFTNKLVTFETYVIGGPLYAKVTHGFWGLLGTSSPVTRTNKDTGEVVVGPAGEGTGGYLSDQFLFILPRIEVGAALGKKALKFTLGFVLGDSTAVVGDTGLYYAVDTGVVLGVALVAGSKAVLHATLRINASFYNAQRSFGDGGGGGLEVVAALKLGSKVALFARAGIDGHTLNGTGWAGSPQGEEGVMKASSVYLRFGLGYSPVP